ncbi:MAG TPA: T9SS type A sorting domain-containing protein [Saprospiraceae bacterium]|nr:T9SS type A sorting domain-containing protein [Saprospiraceae bacterium]
MKKRFTQQLILTAIFAFLSIVAFSQDIVITEIMYNPPESGDDTLEYVEVLNNTGSAYIMTGAKFTDGFDFTFPTMTLNDGEYVVVAKNDTAFFNVFGFYPLEWTSGGLSNGGERLELQDANGGILDSLTYDDGNGWPSEPDGDGASLVLCDVKADNNDAGNWIAATTPVGVIIGGKELKANPGAASSCPTAMALEDDNVATLKDVPAVFDVLANDVIPGTVDAMVVSTPLNGGVAEVNADNKIAYTPPVGGCNVVDVFDYYVTSGGVTDTATVNVTVACSPAYSIGVITTEDADGVADSIGVACSITGVVYGVDMIGGDGIQFTLIDAAGDGIQVRHGSMDLGYTVTEGDELTVVGEVGQYKGLTQFEPATITKNSAGNALLAPTVVTALGEDTESRFIKLENMHVVDMNEWTDAGSGFNVRITNGGTDTLIMRIDNDVDAFNNATLKNMAVIYEFNLTGIGGQYDSSSPYTDGYQILPRSAADFDIILANNNPALQQKINIFPNPTSGDFMIATKDLKVDEIRVVNIVGQTIRYIQAPSFVQTVSFTDMPQGTYFVQITAGDAFTTLKVEKN